MSYSYEEIYDILYEMQKINGVTCFEEDYCEVFDDCKYYVSDIGCSNLEGNYKGQYCSISCASFCEIEEE